MIGRLTGRIESVALGRIIVDVGGVGYEVRVPPGISGRLEESGGDSTVHIHTSVRDDAIDLYGFSSPGRKELFDRLTGVSRIGPKTALGVLSELSPAEVVRAVRSNGIEDFTEVKGIGEKTAQRLVLELKDSINDLDFDEISPAAPDDGDEDEEVRQRVADLRSALDNFGYDSDTIDSVVDEIRPDIEAADGIEPLIRQALDLLRN